MPALDLEIRRRVADYLAGAETLEAFRQWFLPATWNIERYADAATVTLVREIDLLLAEFEHGDWSTTELADKLRPLVTRYSFSIGSRVSTESTSTSQSFGAVSYGRPAGHVDIRPVTVSG